MTVHCGELELVFEVRDGPQAPDDGGEPFVAREVDGQPRVTHDLDTVDGLAAMGL